MTHWRFRSKLKFSWHLAAAHYPCGRFLAVFHTRALGHQETVGFERRMSATDWDPTADIGIPSGRCSQVSAVKARLSRLALRPVADGSVLGENDPDTAFSTIDRSWLRFSTGEMFSPVPQHTKRENTGLGRQASGGFRCLEEFF